MSNGDYYGQPTRSLSNEHLRLEYLSEGGPRIVRLYLGKSEENQLKEAPTISWDTPYGEYHIYGGHRLWHAPESFPRSYIPDDKGVEVESIEEGVRLSGPVEAGTGMRKTMEIRLHSCGPSLTIDHFLKNESMWPIRLAPWAITQFPTGGVMILPQPVGPMPESDLLPNRQLALWPYASWEDARLELHDDYILVHAVAKMPPIKVGYLNTQGWMGYLHQETFFCKRFAPHIGESFPDFGSNCECYCDDRFIEAESIGPLGTLQPGQTVIHTENWEFYPLPAAHNTSLPIIDRVRELVNNWGFGQ